ncbi:MAG TPA: M23 family metallopeptidase [Solirubrobacterales bacterium]|nr:M23 family metallopeptidase [Solirubrobacterales bacterium]
MRPIRLGPLVLAALLAAAVAAAPARATPPAVLSPVAFFPAGEPSPVLATDGRVHLAYELRLANQSGLEVALASVQARAAGRPLGPRLQGAPLEAVLRIDGGYGGLTIPPGGSGTLFMDVAYPPRRQPPRSLLHRIVLVGQPPGQPAAQQTFAFTGVPVPVSGRPAIELAPPLRGPGWVVANGCCSPPNAHRGATLAIDGTVHAPERFAIDFVQLNREGRLFSGPLGLNSSYGFFGAAVHSATAGTVVRVRDGLPEQTPGALPAGATIQNAGGNYVVVAIGAGRYAFYAHLQPGSIGVVRGDRVRVGEVLGRLGNTGNTDAPHLHFHVMDSPSPLESEGLPFTFTTMRGEGRISQPGVLQTGAVVPVDRAAFSGRRRGQMPLNEQVVGFPR